MQAIRSDDNLIAWIRGIRELSNTLNPGTKMRLIEAKRLVDMMLPTATVEASIEFGVWYKSLTIHDEEVQVLSSLKNGFGEWFYVVQPRSWAVDPFLVREEDVHKVLEPLEH